jgi:hypothetical protein
MAAPSVVEQAAEDRLGVEARDAQPRDAAVAADQRRRRAVAHQSQVLEGEMAVAPEYRAKRGISVELGRASEPTRYAAGLE